jgi:molecular chaperone GrpE
MMADETTTPEKQPDGPKAEASAAANDAGPAATAADEPAQLRAEVADMKDKLLRTLAEMENLRKRTERELTDARQYAVASFARDMLTVGDNLRRAIEAVPKESRGSGDQALDALVDGVEMTERGLEQSLSKFGVRRVETKGLKFDPGFHQAMFEVDMPGAQPGTVAEEIQAGYAIGERVLRPALVSVVKKAKQPVAAAPEAEAKPEAAEATAATEAAAGEGGSE